MPNVSATHTDVPGQVAAFELRRSFGRGLNELKYQFSSNRIHTTDDPANVNTRSALGVSIPELFPENNAGRVPSLSVTGLSGITTIQAYSIEYFNNTITDNFTYQRGNHSYKMGVLFAFEQKNENANNQTQGSFAFPAVTSVGRTGFQNFLMGNRDGLCGSTCTYTEAQLDVTNHLRFNRYEAFAQDTWRLGSGVTLDYGIRYSLFPAITDKNNILSTFDPSALQRRRRRRRARTRPARRSCPAPAIRSTACIVAGINSP